MLLQVFQILRWNGTAIIIIIVCLGGFGSPGRKRHMTTQGRLQQQQQSKQAESGSRYRQED